MESSVDPDLTPLENQFEQSVQCIPFRKKQYDQSQQCLTFQQYFWGVIPTGSQ